MKTEILYRYPLSDGYSIERVLPFEHSRCLVLSWKFSKAIKIELISFISGEFAVSEVMASEDFKGEYHIFRTATCFGLLIETNEMMVWKDFNSRPETITIANPFRANKFGGKYRVNVSTFDEGSSAFYFGFEQRESRGFPARYWARLSWKKKSFFGIGLGEEWRWSRESELNLKNYPTTQFSFSDTEFLSINDIMVKSGMLYVHTIGGTTTRLKSGDAYEFSIISKLKSDGSFVKNFSIEEGTGAFSASKEYFILHKRANKKKLTFYTTDDFSVAFEISLTPKQNLADGKSTFIMSDMLDNRLFLYNAGFFNICGFVV